MFSKRGFVLVEKRRGRDGGSAKHYQHLEPIQLSEITSLYITADSQKCYKLFDHIDGKMLMDSLEKWTGSEGWAISNEIPASKTLAGGHIVQRVGGAYYTKLQLFRRDCQQRRALYHVFGVHGSDAQPEQTGTERHSGGQHLHRCPGR